MMVGFDSCIPDKETAASYKLVTLAIYPDIKTLRYVFAGELYINVFDHSSSFGGCK